ncbi:exopolysaccharide biosynthesis protein [Rhodosalinus halophilus]|uniref:Exopolysaccharide biosynthesis protein n=1 Tax=Rhodosalinus halophilus TaxID=2259333 RepID=A0A365U7T4_9RHOB|nr:exopolysaccharide biosynthesis protein [Rhodosalinus halophilus]RBI84815.1 exopolysaccharide biosynthesis protein [Rhodosalinus halophilus]
MADPEPSPDPGPVTISEIIARLEALSDREHVTLGDILASFGQASFVPALMLPGLLVFSPLSGIPLFSSICGLTIAAVSAQMLVRRRHIWLPSVLRERGLSGPRLQAGLSHMARAGHWIDRNTGNRLHLLTAQPMASLFTLVCLCAGLAMPFLELVPFSSSILGLSVVLISSAFLTRDGLYALAGLGVFAVAPMIPLLIWMGLV